MYQKIESMTLKIHLAHMVVGHSLVQLMCRLQPAIFFQNNFCHKNIIIKYKNSDLTYRAMLLIIFHPIHKSI